MDLEKPYINAWSDEDKRHEALDDVTENFWFDVSDQDKAIKLAESEIDDTLDGLAGIMAIIGGAKALEPSIRHQAIVDGADSHKRLNDNRMECLDRIEAYIEKLFKRHLEYKTEQRMEELNQPEDAE